MGCFDPQLGYFILVNVIMPLSKIILNFGCQRLASINSCCPEAVRTSDRGIDEQESHFDREEDYYRNGWEEEIPVRMLRVALVRSNGKISSTL